MTSYPDRLAISPLTAPPKHTVEIPGSKSITNRALILAALAEGDSTLFGALDSEDTRVMCDCLRRLGFEVRAENRGETLHICGQGGSIPASEVELFLANSGTSIRFLTALTALGSGNYRLDGVERMRQRPQQELLTTLQDLGVEVHSENAEHAGCPPLRVVGSGVIRGGIVRLNAEASSQFLTALLMVAPFAEQALTIQIEGALRPFYVDITRRMMAQWGIEVAVTGNTNGAPPSFTVASGQRYWPQAGYQIEPDASSASYFFAAAAVTGGRITIPGLSGEALQGDVRFATEVLTEMGCEVKVSSDGITVFGPTSGRLHGVDRDMSAISDTSLTLAAIAPFADSPTVIRNIAHARKQECDRISAVCTELARLGVKVEEREDGLTIWPISELTDIHPAAIETYRDHRVAMSMALVGLRVPGIEILDPGCVVKTFPGYWERMDLLRSGA